MDAIELIQRLEGVRQSETGYMSKCPAHQDRTASLSVGTGKNGQILLHCFAGCSVHEIAESIGVSLTDLFPERARMYRDGKRPRISPSDLLRVIDFEAEIVLVAADTLANGEGLSSRDYQRLELARDRIRHARESA